MTQPANRRIVTEAAVDAQVAGKVSTAGSATRTALNSTFVPKWKATTAYLAGDKVLSPSGDVVSAKAGFTSGASYNAANWDLSANVVAKLDKTEAAATYATTLIKTGSSYPTRPGSASVAVFVGDTNPEAFMLNTDFWVNTAAPPALQLADVATSITNLGTALYLAVGSAASSQVATSIQIAPDDFAGLSGSPAWAFTGSGAFTRFRGVLLDPASSETVGTVVTIPPGWQHAKAKLLFTVLASTGGDVRWEVGYTKMVDGTDLTTGYTNPGTGVWTTPNANILKVAAFSNSMNVAGGDNLMIRVTRQAVDATDTHTGDAVLVGLVLERVE